MKKLPEEIKQEWLNHPQGYIRYQAQRILLDEDGNKSLLLEDPFVKDLQKSLEDWPFEIMKAHNRPQLGMHRLALLADLGLKKDDLEMEKVFFQLDKRFNSKGIPLSQILMPKAFGGSGQVEPMWFICDFPLILFAMEEMGHWTNESQMGLDYLETLVKENGFPCAVCNPKIKGPGSRKDPCPIACLFSLRALSVRRKNSPAIQPAVEMLLQHWQDRGKKKYYLFGIGTDYKKLKFPLTWYNILHVLHVISPFTEYHKDSRIQEMAQELLSKADDQGIFTPESIYMNYKTQDFGSRKNPSVILSLFAWRILKRLGVASI